jgi:hypothetical protein
MADDYRRIELITGEARRRHWTTEQKLQIIEESSFRVRRYRRLLGYVAWRQISLYRWRRGELLAKAPKLGVLGRGRRRHKRHWQLRVKLQMTLQPSQPVRACG